MSETAEGTTLVGVLVHLIGLLFGILGVAVVYLLASHGVSKANAANALNWQLFYVVAVVVLVIASVALAAVSEVASLVALVGVGAVLLLDVLFCLWATVRAAGGRAWKYPLAPQLF